MSTSILTVLKHNLKNRNKAEMLSIEFNQIFTNKYAFLTTAALCIIPAYSWKSLFSYWKRLKHDYEQEILFQRRHNCVVTYQPNKGISGWPPNINRTKGSNDKLFEDLYEPMLYFIRTSKTSLDIAVMLINVKLLYVELLKAKRRGVTIRVLFNFHHVDTSRSYIRKLIEEGIECQFFVAPTPTLDTIMHHKYMVKDYSGDSGYVCMGSMNFSPTSVVNNYESFIFMSNHNVVEAFENNFEECWRNITIDNEGLINKTILMDAQLDV